MDAAIKKANSELEAKMKRQFRETREASVLVTPWVGDMIAMDSAEEVYRAALDFKKVDHKDIHPSALKAVILAHMSAEKVPVLTMDSKEAVDCKTIFGIPKNKHSRG